MNGRRYRPLLALAAFLTLVGLVQGCVEPGPQAAPGSAPDIILVIIDTWRWDALGANGGARPGITPHLDSLAADGVRFSRAIASSPWTEPSVASILTGRYPTVHGAYGRLADVAPIRERIPTLAATLSAAGYRTVAVVNGFFLAPKLGFDRGFDIYDYFSSSNLKVRRAADSVDVALAHLRAERLRGPVFLLLHLFDPHLAYDPPSPWRDRWTEEYQGPFTDLRGMRLGTLDQNAMSLANIRGLYDGEVAYVDAELGRLMRELEEVLPDRERLVVVTADHGEELGDHGGWEHGHAMYRELVQVPLVLVPPSSRRPSTAVVDAQVRLLDLMPTLLETAGIEPPDDVPGESLFAWFEDSPRTDDLPAYSERAHLGSPSISFRDGDYTLIYHPEERRLELYDQRLDPLETEDIASVDRGRATALKRQLETLTDRLRQLSSEYPETREGVDLSPEEIEGLRSLGYLGG